MGAYINGDYKSEYSGDQIDAAIGKVRTPDSTPTASSDNLVTSGGVKAALDQKQAVINDLSTIRQGASDGTAALTATSEIEQVMAQGYKYYGVATPNTNPGTLEQKVFYIASQPGTYTNLGGIVVNDGEVCTLMWNETSWSKQVTGAATAAQVSQLGQEFDDNRVSVSQNTLMIGDTEVAAVPDTWADSPEWIDVKTDSEGKILEGTKTDATKFISGDLDVVGKIKNDDLDQALSAKENKVIGKSLIDAQYAESQSVINSPEWIDVKTDSEGKILEGTKADGTKVITMDVDIRGKISNLNNSEGGEDVVIETKKLFIDGSTIENIQDPEGRTEIKTDLEGKILSYRDAEGVMHECGKVEVEDIKITNSLTLEKDAKTTFVTDVKASMNMPFMMKKFNLPDYGYIDVLCEIWYVGTDNNEYTPAQVTKISDVYYVTESLTKIVDPVTGDITYEVNANSIATTYTEIDVDFEDATRWPVSKSIKHYCKVKMQFGEIDGTWYALVSFQGTSTLQRPKKGLRIVTYKKVDFAKKDKLKIGEMVSTSKFNCKAYYQDRTRLRDVTLQRLIVEAHALREYNNQYPWNSDYPIFTGAVGTIMSFPVKLSNSGNFYGVSMMGLAKDKANFMLDGDLTGMLIGGKEQASWATFVPEDWEDEMNDEEELTEHGHTPSNYAALNIFFDWVNNGVWDKTTVPQHLYVEDWIDYYIFVQMFRMRDNDLHNLLLFSKADKEKFSAFLYDLDLSWGEGYGNYSVMPIDNPKMVLWKKLVDLYWNEIVDRYKELRASVLNYNHVVNIVTSIQASIPYGDFESEMNKWNELNYSNATKNMLESFKISINFFDEFFIK